MAFSLFKAGQIAVECGEYYIEDFYPNWISYYTEHADDPWPGEDNPCVLLVHRPHGVHSHFAFREELGRIKTEADVSKAVRRIPPELVLPADASLQDVYIALSTADACFVLTTSPQNYRVITLANLDHGVVKADLFLRLGVLESALRRCAQAVINEGLDWCKVLKPDECTWKLLNNRMAKLSREQIADAFSFGHLQLLLRRAKRFTDLFEAAEIAGRKPPLKEWISTVQAAIEWRNKISHHRSVKATQLDARNMNALANLTEHMLALATLLEAGVHAEDLADATDVEA